MTADASTGAADSEAPDEAPLAGAWPAAAREAL